jgi:hypothetical protein
MQHGEHYGENLRLKCAERSFAWGWESVRVSGEKWLLGASHQSIADLRRFHPSQPSALDPAEAVALSPVLECVFGAPPLFFSAHRSSTLVLS